MEASWNAKNLRANINVNRCVLNLENKICTISLEIKENCVNHLRAWNTQTHSKHAQFRIAPRCKPRRALHYTIWPDQEQTCVRSLPRLQVQALGLCQHSMLAVFFVKTTLIVPNPKWKARVSKVTMNSSSCNITNMLKPCSSDELCLNSANCFTYCRIASF